MINQAHDVPYSKLVLSQENMRKVRKERPDLIANIADNGLLQNLLVCAELDAEGKETGMFEVHGGGDRFLAIGFLVASKDKKHKKFTKDYPVRCLVRARADLAGDSMSENYCRLPPHPADVYAQFKVLAEAGESVEGIALRYGIKDPIRVSRTLKLANVSPRIFEAFRKDELTYEHMVAYSISDDHAAQEAIFDGGRHPWAHDVKRALTKGTVSLDDKRVKFVGVEAYTAAGGATIRDLFEQHGGYVTDVALLEELVIKKLEDNQQEILAEGWSWIEVKPDFYHHADTSTFKTIYPQILPLDPETEAKIAALTQESDALTEGEYDEANDARVEEIEAELDALRKDRPEAYDPAEVALAGVVLSLATGGEVKVQRGLVRPGDKSKLTALRRSREAATVAAEGAADSVAKSTGAPSAALMAELTAQLTMALRAEVLNDPDTALRLTVQTLLSQTIWGTYAERFCASTVRYQGHYANIDKFGSDVTTSSAALAVAEAVAQVKSVLPEKAEGLWDYLLTCDREELLALNAVAIQATLWCVSESPAMPLPAAQLAKATNLDMGHYFTPTKESYFGRVSKDQALSDLAEFASAEIVDQARPMKKGDLAAEAAQRVAGTQWVPAVLRVPELVETPSQARTRLAAGLLAPAQDQGAADELDRAA